MTGDSPSGASADIVEVDGQLCVRIVCSARDIDAQHLIISDLNKLSDTAQVITNRDDILNRAGDNTQSAETSLALATGTHVETPENGIG